MTESADTMVASQVEVAVDPDTAFAAFTGELGCSRCTRTTRWSWAGSRPGRRAAPYDLVRVVPE